MFAVCIINIKLYWFLTSKQRALCFVCIVTVILFRYKVDYLKQIWVCNKMYTLYYIVLQVEDVNTIFSSHIFIKTYFLCPFGARFSENKYSF